MSPSGATPPGVGALLLDYATDMLFLVDAISLEIRAVNHAVLLLLGYAEHEIVGRRITEVECALADLFYWEEMRTGACNDLHDAEGLYSKSDGTLLDATKSVIRIPDHPNYLVVRARDISAKKRTEEELAFLASRLRATLEATVDGILVVDTRGKVSNMNRRFAQMWQIPDHLLLTHADRGLLDFIGTALDGSDGAARQLASIGADEHGETFDTLHLADKRVFECKSRPAQHDEQIIGRVFCFTDVTERHAAEQGLIAARDAATAANRAKGDFLAMMSHEIRTPMNGILGMAQLLETSHLDSEQRDYVATMRSSCEALLTIINDILDYSKIEARKLDLETVSFSLRSLVSEVGKVFAVTAQGKALSFAIDIAPSAPDALLGDPVRLRQILMNLLGNAFKFTAAGGISIHVREESREAGHVVLRFSVKDTGIGIPAHQQEHIFTPFEQADMSVTRRFGGTGLGLAICRMLCELMHGGIGVNSAPGEGSEFWFTAKLGLTDPVTEPAAKLPAAGATDASGTLTASTRILVVEDNAVNVIVISNLLKKLGATLITTAKNGLIGVEASERDHFDLIFMDTHMPEMDGLTATRALRDRGDGTYIIGVSANAMPAEHNAALQAGMNDYLAKPVSLDSLRKAIGRWQERIE